MIVEHVRSEIQRLVVEHHITPEYFRDMEINSHVMGDFATTLATRVIWAVTGRVVCKNEEQRVLDHKTKEIGYHSFPATWWDALKRRIYLSDWFGWIFAEDSVTKFVKYDRVEISEIHNTFLTQKIDHWHMCPLPSEVSNRGSHIAFMTGWKEPFTGSQREYTLLRNIAKEVLVDRNVMYSYELSRLLSEYVRESEVLADLRSR